jgi:hypothetical protein
MKSFLRCGTGMVLALLACTAQAVDPQTLPDCVTLGQDQQIVRTGSSQQFFLKNGQDHYRVSVGNGCGALAIASRIDIHTDGTDNRLCPSGSQVKTNRESCPVSAVALIDAEEFSRRQKRARR